jgi:hypothetical protein
MAIQPNRRRKHRFAAPIGGAFLLLAAIGVITIIVLSIRLTQQVLDNQNQKEMFERMIRPVVMFDPVPFESAENLSNTDLLLFSMWSTLTSEKRKNYTYGENQELLVSSSDLDVAARSLFGGVVKLTHESFGNFEARYTYEAEMPMMYSVPVLVELFVYSPRVTEITRDGDYYSLTVEYVPPGSAWTANFEGDTQEPAADKTMIYVMAQEKDGWHIVKVQDQVIDPDSGLPAIRS